MINRMGEIVAVLAEGSAMATQSPIMTELLKYVRWPKGEQMWVDMNAIMEHKDEILALDHARPWIDNPEVNGLVEKWWTWEPQGGSQFPLWWNNPTRTVVSVRH